jgi:hypothetical protein
MSTEETLTTTGKNSQQRQQQKEAAATTRRISPLPYVGPSLFFFQEELFKANSTFPQSAGPRSECVFQILCIMCTKKTGLETKAKQKKKRKGY